MDRPSVGFYFAESVTRVLDLVRGHGIAVQERPQRGHFIGDGKDHRLYSHADLLNIGDHGSQGIPSGAMAYIELCTHSPSFPLVKGLIEEAIADQELTPIQEMAA